MHMILLLFFLQALIHPQTTNAGFWNRSRPPQTETISITEAIWSSRPQDLDEALLLQLALIMSRSLSELKIQQGVSFYRPRENKVLFVQPATKTGTNLTFSTLNNWYFKTRLGDYPHSFSLFRNRMRTLFRLLEIMNECSRREIDILTYLQDVEPSEESGPLNLTEVQNSQAILSSLYFSKLAQQSASKSPPLFSAEHRFENLRTKGQEIFKSRAQLHFQTLLTLAAEGEGWAEPQAQETPEATSVDNRPNPLFDPQLKNLSRRELNESLAFYENAIQTLDVHPKSPGQHSTRIIFSKKLSSEVKTLFLLETIVRIQTELKLRDFLYG